VPSQLKLFRQDAMFRLVWHHTGVRVNPPKESGERRELWVSEEQDT